MDARSALLAEESQDVHAQAVAAQAGQEQEIVLSLVMVHLGGSV